MSMPIPRTAFLDASAKVQIDGLIEHCQSENPVHFDNAVTSAYRILRETGEPNLRLVPVPLNPWSPEEA